MVVPSDTNWIPAFVRQRLGCTCPDEVFQSVSMDPEFRVAGCADPLVRIGVGGRLLIYLMPDVAAAAVKQGLPQVVETGVAERDRRGYNRLRIVLDCRCPEAVARVARPLFERLPQRDDRTHLHVLDAEPLKAGER
jgi:hypothetical protein